MHLTVRRQRSEADWEEFCELVHSAGVAAAATVKGVRETPDARTYVGSGKLEEVRAAMLASDAAVVLFNNELSATQQRNLERALECKVLDRTGVILDIFAQRAQSFEGKLQVELAQLRYLSTRLIRGWTHLERQKGGIGLRGPGETQLETDRRLIDKRIKQLHARLEKVRKQRGQRRRARRRAALSSVSIVGYTNAGKSTLFNRLGDANEYAADQLFATLDTKMRRIQVPGGRAVVISDTVGFIRHLPHDLVAAFRATLEEACEADLLLHVIDVGATDRTERKLDVEQVLEQIGADRQRCLEVYNKIDCLDGVVPHVDYDAQGQPCRAWVSAKTGAGVVQLTEAIGQSVREGQVRGWLHLTPAAGQVRANLYDSGAVVAERVTEDGCWLLDVHMQQSYFQHFCDIKGVSRYSV